MLNQLLAICNADKHFHASSLLLNHKNDVIQGKWHFYFTFQTTTEKHVMLQENKLENPQSSDYE